MKFIGEIESLCSEGYGILITKEDMIADGKMPKNCCSTVHLVPHNLNTLISNYSLF